MNTIVRNSRLILNISRVKYVKSPIQFKEKSHIHTSKLSNLKTGII